MQTQSPPKHDEHRDGDADGLGCVRGLMWATPCGIITWAIILYFIFGRG